MKIEFSKMYKWKCIGLSLVIAVLCYLIQIYTQLLYTNHDNMWVSIVVNGIFDNDNYCIYLHPFLCWFFKVLKLIIPSADVFATTGFICISFSIFIFSYLALTLLNKKLSKCLFIILIVFLTFALSMWNNNYTVQAAYFSFIGVVLFFTGCYHNKLFYIILGILYYCLGFMWRQESALLFIPFIILEIVFYVLENRLQIKKSGFKFVKCVGLFLLCVAVLMVGRCVVQNSNTYKNSVEYNQYRTDLEDYPCKSWEELSTSDKEVINQNYYDSVCHWFLADTDVFNNEFIKTVANAGKNSDLDLSINNIIISVKGVLILLYCSGFTIIIFVIALILLSLLVLITGNKYSRIKCIFSILGSAIILVYFNLIGRAPMRVIESVFLALLSILVVFFINNQINNREKFICVINFILCCLLLLSIVKLLPNVILNIRTTAQMPFNSCEDVDEQKFSDTFNDNSLFLWKSWYINITSYYIDNGKLPTSQFINHNIPIGDWVYGQVYFNNHLVEIDAENPALALLDRNNTYLVDEDYKTMLLHLKEHYGDNIDVEYAGSIADVPYWRFFRK
ncbi:MAG: hypothetical protein MJ089_07575 [Ruminococcus sp.]|nr:hypothetical protein [Ruminococcus sp.]